MDLPALAKIELIARELTGGNASHDRAMSAIDFAAAQTDLLRIRSVRAKSQADGDIREFSARELKRLGALDRYERYALTKRRRAVQRFENEN